MKKNRVDVVIDGQIITLVSEEDEVYLQRLAIYIDRKLAEINASQPHKPVSEHARTLRISANIADDYFKTLDSLCALSQTHEDALEEMRALKSESEQLKDTLRTLRTQIQDEHNQRSQEKAFLDKENAKLARRVQDLKEQLKQFQSQNIQDIGKLQAQNTRELKQLREENEILAEAKLDLQEQLRHARKELEDYIGNFDLSERKVINFGQR